MAPVNIRWNTGMTVAALLLVTGGVLVVMAGEPGTPLHTVGFGILVMASVVYMGARIWMLTRKQKR
jgi:hypothetical protein